jgi:hypothetical protein
LSKKTWAAASRIWERRISPRGLERRTVALADMVTSCFS